MELRAIGEIRTCFKEKFGVPRQPNLVAVQGRVVLYPEFAREEAFRGLSDFSHIWLVFLFDRAERDNGEWSPMVRPPRLGGNRKVGVFATRSPFRPNPVGMSCVRLDGVDSIGKELHVTGADLVDRTPILDIKPYLPYADSLPYATGGFAPEPPGSGLEVAFSSKALAEIEARQDIPGLRRTIEGILEADPRPAYTAKDAAPREYGMRLFDFNLKFTIQGKRAEVTELAPL